MDEKEKYRLYNAVNTAGWAKSQLKILHEMLDDRAKDGDFNNSHPLSMEWLASETKRIMDGFEII